jgi:hypothetical protein
MAHPHTIAFLQLHTIELDTPAGHVHIGVVVGCKLQGRAFLAVDQCRLAPCILAHLQRAVAAVR